MIHTSSALVLSLAAGGDINGNNPVIGIDNLVTVDRVSADEEADGYPVTNLANPITSLGAGWRGESTDAQVLAVLTEAAEEIDYVAFARPNFGSAGIAVGIWGRADPGDPFVELVEEVMPADDGPLLFRFEPQSLYEIEIRMASGTAPPQASVLYVGKLLVLQRRIYVGHTPINLGRAVNFQSGRSESGAFLGRIVTGERRQSTVSLENLTPAWYREYFDPFVVAARNAPFFFAWRPLSYPLEVGFAWLLGDPMPTNQRPNGMMQVSFEMGGIA